MEKSESIKNISIALCKFQSEVGKIKKDTTNPFFKSKYANLSSIIDAITQPLADNELSYVQFPSGQGGLTTLLMHSSGEWIQDTYIMRPVKNDPQSLGSIITYQRRYALGAVLGLNIDDDDDGNIASVKTKKTAAELTLEIAKKKKPFPSGFLQDERYVDQMFDLMDKALKKTPDIDLRVFLSNGLDITEQTLTELINRYQQR